MKEILSMDTITCSIDHITVLLIPVYFNPSQLKKQRPHIHIQPGMYNMEASMLVLGCYAKKISIFLIDHFCVGYIFICPFLRHIKYLYIFFLLYVCVCLFYSEVRGQTKEESLKKMKTNIFHKNYLSVSVHQLLNVFFPY